VDVFKREPVRTGGDYYRRPFLIGVFLVGVGKVDWLEGLHLKGVLDNLLWLLQLGSDLWSLGLASVHGVLVFAYLLNEDYHRGIVLLVLTCHKFRI